MSSSDAVRSMTAESRVVIRSTPTYFGEPSARVFGVFSAPADSVVRAGVLVCSSLGKEQAETTRWFKMFAERLARDRVAVLRFDYPHTGESTGAQDDAAAAQRWIAGISTAAQYLRSAGVDDVIAVGHRVGTLLLAQAAADLDLSAVVLWDPIRTGRTYLRSKAVLYNMVSDFPEALAEHRATSAIAGPAADETVHVAGLSLHPDVASTLSSLKLTAESFGALPALVLSQPGPVVDQFTSAGAEFIEIGDQEPYLQPSHPSLLSFPVDDIETVTGWIAAHCDNDPHTLDAPVTDRAVVGRSADGRPIVTRVYSTPSSITVWDTVIESDSDTSPKPVVVAHSLGQYVRSGPARLFYETALAVAARGGRAVRYDRIGVGESGMAAIDDGFLPIYTQDHLDNGVAVLDELQPALGGARIVHAGICAASWMAAHGALATAGTAKSAVLLINPLMWRLRPQRRFRLADAGADAGIAGAGRADEVNNSLPARVRRKLIWIGGRSAPRIRTSVPRRWWPAVGAVPLMSVPDSLFAELGRSGVDAHVAFSPVDYAYFDLMSGAQAALAAAREPVGLYVSAEGDHTAYHIAMRRVVTDAVLTTLGLAERRVPPH